MPGSRRGQSVQNRCTRAHSVLFGRTERELPRTLALEPEVQMMLPGEAYAAMQLQRSEARGATGLVRSCFREACRGDSVFRRICERVPRVPDERPGGFGLQSDVCETMLERLERCLLYTSRCV